MTPIVLHSGMAGICQAIREATCGHCWAAPGQPCVTYPATVVTGVHMARAGRAYRRGLITETEFGAVLHAAGAFTAATILYEPGSQP